MSGQEGDVGSAGVEAELPRAGAVASSDRMALGHGHAQVLPPGSTLPRAWPAISAAALITFSLTVVPALERHFDGWSSWWGIGPLFDLEWMSAPDVLSGFASLLLSFLVIALAIATGVSSRVGPGITTLRVVLLAGTATYAISAVARGPVQWGGWQIGFPIVPMALLVAAVVFLALPLTRRAPSQLSAPGMPGIPGMAGPSVGAAAMGPLLQEDGTAQCPLCRETIHPEALLCRHCGSHLGGGAQEAGAAATGLAAPTQPQETSGLAVASLVCSILACGIGSLLGVIFGHMALSRIEQSGRTIGGRGLALAGTIIGWIGLAAAITYLVFMLVIWNSTPTYDY